MAAVMAEEKDNVKVVARNRKARHEYDVEDTYEAGIVLEGTEVKSLREGDCSIAEAFARPRGEEIYLFDMHIPPYGSGNIRNHEPTRPRKLLLHRKEIGSIISQCSQRGYTLIPLSVYFKRGLAKVQIGLARHRKHWDKRRQIEDEQRRRDARSELGRRRRSK